MYHRIDNFNGSDAEYILHLEWRVRKLRQRRCTCSHLDSPIEPPPAVCNYSDLKDPEHGGQTKFIPWNPGQPPPRARSSKRPKIDGTLWRKGARALVEKTPKGKDWWQKVRELGVYEGTCNGKAAEFLLDISCDAPETNALHASPQSPVTLTSALLNHVAGFAKTAARRTKTASLALTLANFQKFLVLSACAVLRDDASIAIDKINVIVRICIGERSEESCQRALKTVLFLNELIDALNTNGWGNRASELLIVWNQPPTSYRPLAASESSSLEYLKTTLSESQFMEGVERHRGPNSFFVPSLVCVMLQNRIHVARISSILKYKHAHPLQEMGEGASVNPWLFEH